MRAAVAERGEGRRTRADADDERGDEPGDDGGERVRSVPSCVLSSRCSHTRSQQRFLRSG